MARFNSSARILSNVNGFTVHSLCTKKLKAGLSRVNPRLAYMNQSVFLAMEVVRYQLHKYQLQVHRDFD